MDAQRALFDFWMRVWGYWQGWYLGFERGWLDGYKLAFGLKSVDEPAELF